MSFRIKCFLVAIPVQAAGLVLHTYHPIAGSIVIGFLVGTLIGLLDD